MFASFTLAFALQLRKKHGKTSIRVRKKPQSGEEKNLNQGKKKPQSGEEINLSQGKRKTSIRVGKCLDKRQKYSTSKNKFHINICPEMSGCLF